MNGRGYGTQNPEIKLNDKEVKAGNLDLSSFGEKIIPTVFGDR
jgi:hypothetical protein